MIIFQGTSFRSSNWWLGVLSFCPLGSSSCWLCCTTGTNPAYLLFFPFILDASACVINTNTFRDTLFQVILLIRILSITYMSECILLWHDVIKQTIWECFCLITKFTIIASREVFLPFLPTEWCCFVERKMMIYLVISMCGAEYKGLKVKRIHMVKRIMEIINRFILISLKLFT